MFQIAELAVEFRDDRCGSGIDIEIQLIQLAIRLLIPEGSLMLDLADVRARIEPFDSRGLCYPWRNRDPEMDRLSHVIQEVIKREERHGTPRIEIFRRIWELSQTASFPEIPMPARATIPYLTEPWYC